MNFVDATVKVRHPCPFCDFSAEFPDAQMALWCNGSNEVLQITLPDPERLDEVLEAAAERLDAREMIRDGRSALNLTRTCVCRKYRSVMTIADENEVWLLPPTVYSGGWETHRVLAKGAQSISRFAAEIRKSGEVHVVSKKPREHLDMIQDLSIVPVHFFGGLTERQIRMLVTAYENGLFDVPAKNKMDRVAEMEGLSRSTYGEHLRKAQLQLLRNSYPFLKLRDQGRSRGGPESATCTVQGY